MIETETEVREELGRMRMDMKIRFTITVSYAASGVDFLSVILPF